MAKKRRVSQTDLPRVSLEKALGVPRALIEQFAGEPTPPIDLALAVGVKPSSSGWRDLTGAAIGYGLTEGGSNAPSISLTDLGRRAVAPVEQGEDIEAMREAGLKPTIMKRFLDKYDGNKFPREDIARNVLGSQFEVPPTRIDEALALIESNADTIGAFRTMGGDRYVTLAPIAPGQRASAEATETSGQDPPPLAPEPVAVAADGAKAAGVQGDRPVKAIFVGHSKGTKTLEQVKQLLELADLRAEVVVEQETAAIPVPDKIFEAMRRSDAARFELSEAGELTFRSAPDYENSRDTNRDNVYEVTIIASDGNFTDELDVDVTVTNVNEVASTGGPTFISFSENDTTAVAIYSATDPDGDEVTWDVAGVDAVWFEISAAGELSFDSPPDYEDPGDASRDNVYEVTVTASDGILEATLDVEVTVTNVDEPPLIAGPVSIIYAENSSDSVAEYTLVDPDGEDDTATGLEVAGTDATHFAIDNLGSLTFVASPNFENPLDADSNNAYLLRIVWDSDANENSLDVVVEVTDVNDAPRFPSTAVVAEIPENSCPGAYIVYRGIGGDLDSGTDEDGDLLTYEVSGPDAQAFVIHPPTGYVTLGPGTLLDFETSRRPFILQVSVSDGRDDLGNVEDEFKADDFLDLTVIVSDVNEPPVFAESRLTVDACGGPLGHEPEQLRREVTAGTRGGSRVGAPLSAADPEGEPVRFMMVSQSDQGAFIVGEVSGQVMVSPDFSPRDARRVYTLRVAATDGELESHIEVRISVAKAPKPDDDDSSTRRPDSSNNVEVSEAVPSNETLDNSATLDENATDSIISAGILDQSAVGLKQVEPVFVPVPRAAQTQLFGRSEVQDQTGRARFTAPAGILAVPYQVRLTRDEDACALLDGINPRLGCLSVSLEFFDMAGEPIAPESLNRPGLLEIVLKTQNGSGDIEARGERAGISNKSFALMMRLDEGQEWGNTRANLRKLADGSSILVARVRAPGQYMALVTEPGVEMRNRDSVAPLVLRNVAGVSQTQNTVIESAPERAVSLVYSPVAAESRSQPVTVVSAEPRVWQTLSLLIALLLDVMVALSAGIFFHRFTSRPH